MKIVNGTKDFDIFDDLDFGDVFRHDGFTYMKIVEIETPDDDDFDCINAVNLMNGEVMWFDYTTEVLAVDATLTVK